MNILWKFRVIRYTNRECLNQTRVHDYSCWLIDYYHNWRKIHCVDSMSDRIEQNEAVKKINAYVRRKLIILIKTFCIWTIFN